MHGTKMHGRCYGNNCLMDSTQEEGAFFGFKGNTWLCDLHAKECREALKDEGRYTLAEDRFAIKTYYNEIKE